MKAIVDCNNFYCSCERLFKPHLKTTPMVVLSNNDGCIISISDEAKKLGVKTGEGFYAYAAGSKELVVSPMFGSRER
jgi:DNA polymerase V